MSRTALLVSILIGLGGVPTRAIAQTAGTPDIVGRLVGPGASPAQPALHLYGTDLGWTYEHKGRLFMLFGDTWPKARALCEGEPRNDDTVATLPLEPPAGVPPLTFVTLPDMTDEFAPILLRRGAESLPMAYGQVPIAGFSDGTNAAAILGRGEPVRCTQRSPRKRPTCRPAEHLACTEEVGECLPALLEIPALCDLASGTGCLPGSTCQPSPTGFCIDPTSSQTDGTPATLRFQVAHRQEIAIQDPASATNYRSAATLDSNKFINAASRTVRCFTGQSCGSDYGAGHGALLVWGRPFFTAEGGREAQLYLMVHKLPLRLDRQGRTRLRPRYFAGLDPATGEPTWSRRQSRAMPLALDGVAGGSPHEQLPIVSQMAVSWVGAPVHKWVMLYGGDLPDFALQDTTTARVGPEPGSIRIRFADHPWGPWSPPRPHLPPGSPDVAGDPYGPGGVLYHTRCVDQGGAACAPGDPTRPIDFFFPGCPPVGAASDIGRFYGPNLIDAYARPEGAQGVSLVWNVSTWNPYGVVLVRSTITAAPDAAPPPPCARGGRAGDGRRLRWCATAP